MGLDCLKHVVWGFYRGSDLHSSIRLPVSDKTGDLSAVLVLRAWVCRHSSWGWQRIAELEESVAHRSRCTGAFWRARKNLAHRAHRKAIA
jgi:hypothetical protein